MQWSRGIAGLLAVGLIISLRTNVRRGERIATLEARLQAEATGEVAVREITQTAHTNDLGRPDGDAALHPDSKPGLEDVVDIAASLAAEEPSLILTLPEVEEAMEQQLQDQLTVRRKAWQNRQLEVNRDSLNTYAEETGLDEEVTADIDELMEETMFDIASLRQERHAGEIPDDEAFEELGHLRSDFRKGLFDLVGEDEAAVIQEHLMGPLNRNYYDHTPSTARPEER